MSLYTPRQILLILSLVGAAGAGLAIDHVRRARPDLVERLERLDRVERVDSSGARSPADAGRTSDDAVGRSPLEVAAPRSSAVEPSTAEGRGGPRAPARTRRESGRARRTRPAAPAEPVDVNRASEPELLSLPGVGPALAARIVAARPFADVDDLRRVRGLRHAMLERLRPLLAPLP